jgi:hypothetical protein
VARAFRDDPVSARSEYGQAGAVEFRDDISGFVSAEAVAAVTPVNVRELAPVPGTRYVAHLDAATGAGADAWALAIAHHDGARAVLDAVRLGRPPFSPGSMAAEAAQALRRYGVTRVTLDRFAPNLVADLMAREGIRATAADGDTSAAFLDMLTAINSRACTLLDHDDLLREVRALERRAVSGGRDRISHPPRQHDDVAAACAFALTAAREAATRGGWELLFAGAGDPTTAALESEVERLRRLVSGATASAIAHVRNAATSARRAVGRLRPRSLTPEERAERQRQAAYLKASRQQRRDIAAARDQAEGERRQRAEAEREYERAQRLRAEREILAAIETTGCWFPADRSILVPFDAYNDDTVGSWRR